MKQRDLFEVEDEAASAPAEFHEEPEPLHVGNKAALDCLASLVRGHFAELSTKNDKHGRTWYHFDNAFAAAWLESVIRKCSL